MSYLINNQQKMNDVIFSDRNKNYGAYVIRSSYGGTIFKSLSFMILGFGIMMSLAFHYSNRNNTPQTKPSPTILNDSNIVTVFDMEPPKELSETKKPLENHGKTEAIVSDRLATKINDSLTVETNTLINTDEHIVSTLTTTGAGTEGDSSGSVGKGTGSVVSTVITESVSELYFVDTPPEFEGGLNALYKFIASNMVYPIGASEAGKEGVVHVKFVVDENGKVGSLNLLNKLGFGLDDEALRVVALIPKFKSPAKIKGKAVKVNYQLPIRYKLR